MAHYYRPTTLEEAFADAGAGAHFVAGGTDLLVQVKRGAVAPPGALISLRSVAELAGIEVRGDVLRIGAGVPLADIAADARVAALCPALVQAIGTVGSRQIRNVATLGGNLVNASPAADTAPPLLVYGARAELATARARRELPLQEFLRGPGETALAPGEVMTAVLIDHPAAGLRSAFLRKGRVAMDLATASVAVALLVKDGICRHARVAAGAVAPTPLRLEAAEVELEGSALDEATAIAASEAAQAAVSPIDDLRGTADYRRHLVGVFLRRLIAQLTDEGPA